MEENWFDKSYENVAKILDANIEKGLKTEDVIARREKYGENKLKEGKKKNVFQKFIEQFKDFTIIVLIIAAIVSGVIGVVEEGIGGLKDSIIIMIIVILNAVIGIAQENKAEKSLEALQKLSEHASKVIRNGKIEVVPSRELVPGDIVVLETGDYISADLRIIEAINLKAQESSLTRRISTSRKKYRANR